MDNVTVNAEQKLYVLPTGNGYSCIGFTVAQERTNAVIKELIDRGRLTHGEAHSLFIRDEDIGTMEAYAMYKHAVELARLYCVAQHTRMHCQLTPQLVGLEGKRVEVVDCYGEKRRFKVGKSTGWLPIHLELYNSLSHGGGAITGAPFKSVREV